MRFYDRGSEISHLRKECDLSEKVARLTVVTGRKRVGKTQLIQKAMDAQPYVGFLVTRRAEIDQCADFIENAKAVLPISIHGDGVRFGTLFKALMEESCRRPFTLVVDELPVSMHVDWVKFYEGLARGVKFSEFVKPAEKKTQKQERNNA